MAIIKKTKNIYSQIEEEYTSICGDFTETSDAIIIDSVEGNLSLNSNKKIIAQGNKDE